MAYTTIDDPEAYFQTVIWTGNGTDGRTITLPGSTDMQPDFIWVKNRTDGEDHCLMDSVRTFASGKALRTNGADEEGGVGTANRGWVEAASDGFTCEDGSTNANLVNDSSDAYVAWCWKAGTTSGITTTGANITPSAYSFNTTSGISIIKYEGNGTDGTNTAHGLGAVPHMIIVKRLENVNYWAVYHHKNTSAPNTDYLVLNATDATSDAGIWKDSDPTSVYFRHDNSTSVNANGEDMVAYLFTSIQGYSKFGSYLGNGNANGTYVYTGFRPAFVLVKRTNTSGGNWWLWDNKRLGYNAANDNQYADLNNAEDTSGRGINLLSNGFKCISTDNGSNGSGNTYIYAAFAHSPFVNSSGVPNNPR